MTKNRGACALTRAGGSLYTIKLKPESACREQDLSLSGLDPVPLSKIGTHLLASPGGKGKNTVRHRGMETRLTETILIMMIRASGVPGKIGTLLLGSWWP